MLSLKDYIQVIFMTMEITIVQIHMYMERYRGSGSERQLKRELIVWEFSGNVKNLEDGSVWR